MSINKVKKSEIQTDFLCIICNKFYASANSLCNHQKRIHKNSNNDHNNNNNIREINNKNILQCEYCNKIFSSRSTKSEHKKKACKFNNNIINNTTNINNIINNNITNNIIIKINNFGDEDLSHLTQQDITDMIKKGFSCVFDYIDKVHLNPNKPENNNIMLTNLKSGLIKIFQNYGWKMAKCNDILTSIIDKCHELTLHNYNDLKDNKKFHCKAYERWLSALNNNVDKTYNDKYPDMKIQLYNK